MVNSQFSFHDRFTAAYPSQITVDVTNVCNLQCVHCQQSICASRPEYAKHHLTEELHTKLVQDVSDHGMGTCQYLRYTAAGEPLLHPNILEFLAYAKENSGTTISLTTNGTLLDAKKRAAVLQYVDIIDISIDAYSPEVYAQVRRGGNRNSVYANVEQLIAEKKESGAPLRVVTTFIEQNCNVHEVSVFKQYWNEMGADYVVIRRLHSCAGADKEVAAKMREQIGDMERYPCPYPWERLMLSPDGTLVFCPVSWYHGADFADFSNVSISEAWQSPFMKELRSAHLANNFRAHPLCGQCPDWSTTRWPHMGRSFADMVHEFKGRE